MKIKDLKIISYLYLIIPIICFVVGWLKPIISIPVAIILIGIIIKIIRENEKNENEPFISKWNVLVIFEIILIICITAGQGNMFYQSNDWHWRNAIFRDLINFKWPVYYENIDASLTYYIGFWIVPAVFGKIFLQLFGANIAWYLTNFVSLIWCTIGVTLSILWIIKILKIKKDKKIFLTILLFLGFSGLDIVGIWLTKNIAVIYDIHLEWWATKYQFSAMLTQLFWVFNQCVASWLITIMFIDEKKVNNYLTLILLCLPYSPIPFVGLIPLFGVRGIKYLIEAYKNNQIKEFFKDVFSIQNVLSLITILPIYYLYYSNNAATSTGVFRLDTSIFTLKGIGMLLLFYFLEIGIYGIFLLKENKKDELFITALIALLFIPMFKLGLGEDFAMRASIPSLLIIIYYFIKHMMTVKLKNWKTIVLIIIFAIGFVTPLFEYKRAIHYITLTKKINIVADRIKTFSDKSPEGYENFLCVNPKEKSILFKYLSK